MSERSGRIDARILGDAQILGIDEYVETIAFETARPLRRHKGGRPRRRLNSLPCGCATSVMLGRGRKWMQARARVRWGTARFFRIDEFAAVEGAKEFAGRLPAIHGDHPGFGVVVEIADGPGWRVAVSYGAGIRRSETRPRGT